MNEEKMRRDIERLEQMERRTRDRLRLQQKMIDKRFDRMRERISRKYGETSNTQQRIIDAALELLQEDGLNNLSLRKLAAKINMQAPALYWHFKNKDILIDFMAEEILKREFPTLEPRRHDEPWQDWLIAICQRLRHAMLSYRDGGRVVTGAHFDPAVTLMKLFEVSMESLTSAGIELRQANLIASTAVHFVFGNVIEQQSSPSPAEAEKMNIHDLKESFPFIAQSIQHTIDDMRNNHDEFEDALRLIIHD